jgi:cyclohexanone monooxygenase
MYHTGNWPRQYDFANKRVGILGNGSTGCQVITALAPHVKQLISFQRTRMSVLGGDFAS